MLTFDVVDDQITLSAELQGHVLSETPDKYIYFMDYLDIHDLVYKTARLLRDQEPPDQMQPIDMVAASWARNYGDCYAVFSPIIESSYAVIYFSNAIVTKEHLQQLIETTASLAGKLIGGKDGFTKDEISWAS